MADDLSVISREGRLLYSVTNPWNFKWMKAQCGSEARIRLIGKLPFPTHQG